MFDCKNQGLTELPECVENNTEWVLLGGNNISRICGDVKQLTNVSRIELQNNIIDEICDESMEQFVTKMEFIDISHNSLSYLPKTVQESANSTVLKIGVNPYRCHCNMLWMANSTRYIPDYTDARCVYGKRSGLQIYMVNETTLGCGIPLPVALISGTSVGVVVLVILIIVFFRNLDVIKFQFFLRLNIRVNEDQAEVVDSMEFDALVAYKLV